MKRNRTLASLLLLLPFSLLIAQGGPSSPVELTVDDCVRMGLSYSKGLDSSRWEVEHSRFQLKEVQASALPSLSLSGTYTRLSKTPSFGVTIPGSDSTFVLNPSIADNYSSQLTLKAPLFTGGKLSSLTTAARSGLEASKELYNRDRKELVLTLRSSYWNLYRARELEGLILENVELIKVHLEQVNRFYDQGLAKTNEVLKVKVQLSSVELKRVEATNGVRLASKTLASLLGLPLETTFALKTDVQREIAGVRPVETLVEEALRNRPEIKAASHSIKAGEAQVKAAEGELYPSLALLGNYTYARPNSRIMPVEEKFNDTWDVSLALSFDLWNWGIARHKAGQARARLIQSRDQSIALKDSVTLEVHQIYNDTVQAVEKIKVAQEGVALAQENYRITNERFKAGLTLNSELLDAEVALLQAKVDNTQSWIDYELNKEKLKKALGQE